MAKINPFDMIGSVAESVKKTAGEVGDFAVDTAKKAADGAGELASGAAQKAGEIADEAGEAVDKGIQFLKENSKENLVKQAKLAAFRDGINKGAALAAKKGYAYYFGLTAALTYAAFSDGVFTDEEEAFFDETFALLKKNKDLPKDVKDSLVALSKTKELAFENVAECLDPLSIENVQSVISDVESILSLEGECSGQDEKILEEFSIYLTKRIEAVEKEEGLPINVIRVNEEVEAAVAEYGDNIDRINQEFKEKTKLQDADLGFLLGATMLQVARIYLLDSLTKIEKAGKGAREEALHNAQDKALSPFEKLSDTAGDRLKAPTAQIIGRPGVPYDATAGKALGCFQGG